MDVPRAHVRPDAQAVALLADVGDADGSFADLVDARSCTARAGVDATAAGFDAVDAAVASDVARAERLLERAEITLKRCKS